MELIQRPRRLRVSPLMREIVAETDISPRHLITPHFVVEGEGHVDEIASMPGVTHVSADKLVEEIAADVELGLKSHLLFGIPDEAAKDHTGSAAVDENGVVARALRALRERFGDEVVLITDVCLCAYTSHGHCGFLEDGVVVNDTSVAQLARMALTHARAGADMVMVKPALAYLDVVRGVRAEALCPVVCYNVSGEYSMVKAAAAAGYCDERAIVTENLLAMRRAGADLIITYHGRDALRGGWIR